MLSLSNTIRSKKLKDKAGLMNEYLQFHLASIPDRTFISSNEYHLNGNN